jgi:membrane fusion protein (multidrug efflux system)
VEFAVPEDEAALLRARLSAADEVIVRLLGENGDQHPQPARLTFVDNRVEPGSGTVRARAVMDNPDARFVPGQFVRVRVEGVFTQGGVSVPDRAVMSSAQGRFVWVIGDDNVATMRPVQVSSIVSGRALVADGLAAGERVVVEGVLKVRPGAPVAIADPQAATPQGPPEPAAVQGQE